MIKNPWLLPLLVLCVLAPRSGSSQGSLALAFGPDNAPAEIAVIVHPSNTMADPTMDELRAILTLERQFWPDRRRIVYLIPKSGSSEMTVLLDKVYRTTEERLRKSWVAKVFAGEIQAIPSSARSGEAAVGAVKKSPEAISVILAKDVPDGIRVLAIDGKRPGEAGYLLRADKGLSE